VICRTQNSAFCFSTRIPGLAFGSAYICAARPLIFCFCMCFCILCTLVTQFSISACVFALNRSAHSLAFLFLHITAYFISADPSIHAVAESMFCHTCCIVASSIYAEVLPLKFLHLHSLLYFPILQVHPVHIPQAGVNCACIINASCSQPPSQLVGSSL
jgi:hypothetical protein